MTFDGLESTSMKLAVTLLAAIMLIFGTSWFVNTGIAAYTQTIIMLFVAIILLVEVGLKLGTPLSTLKRLGLVQYISLSVALVLIIGAIIALPIVSVTSGPGLTTLTNLGIAAGAAFIAAEAFI